MIEMRLADIAQAVEGQLHGEDAMARGVAIDSRKVGEGMLFAALQGAQADGHDFVATALERGAAAALVEHDIGAAGPLILVQDVQAALGLLARAWRRKLNPKVIGITGSNGKTTTKEMVYAILRREHSVLATRGNYNNELGVPLTVFDLAPEHEFAVLEMGASKAGDIAYLAGIGLPDIALVTNVGPAHLEGFGDEAGVARAKGEIYEHLPAGGYAIMNGGQSWLGLWRGLNSAGHCLTFGLSPDCDVYADRTQPVCRIHTPKGSFPLKLALPGEHNLENALAATAVAVAAGVDRAEIKAGLESVRPVPGRLRMQQAPGGWNVIDDTYNANPASLYAALQVLATKGGERWLVLGDMAELGSHSRKMHAEMGEAARALGVARLYAVGEFSRASVDAFGEGAQHFAEIPALLEQLLEDLNDNTTCLVKGSRSMGMERVVEAIMSADVMSEVG